MRFARTGLPSDDVDSVERPLRTMFWLYLLLIVAGIALYSVVGITHR